MAKSREGKAVALLFKMALFIEELNEADLLPQESKTEASKLVGAAYRITSGGDDTKKGA